jgi:hypothetical protein
MDLPLGTEPGYRWTALPCEYCGASELEHVLHCDECGEPILHGYERASMDDQSMIYCESCQLARRWRNYERRRQMATSDA